jgi:hypothetical protein
MITSETIAQMADELVATPVQAEDRQTVAFVLAVLGAEIAAMRALDVGEREPATTYEADPS